MTAITNEKKDYLSIEFDSLVLSHEKIDSASFEECTFKNCNFSETEFTGCQFTDCHFSQCNLSNMKIFGSIFSEVILEDSKAIGIDWTKAEWPDIPLFAPIKFVKSILDNSVFMGLTLKEIVIDKCRAHEVDFREGIFSGAVFASTDFAGCLFNETDLSGADFTEAINYTIDIKQNVINGVKFSRHEAVSLLEGLGILLTD
jgi:uncharacterized protein YjbI with pentapeptide repeats